MSFLSFGELDDIRFGLDKPGLLQMNGVAAGGNRRKPKISSGIRFSLETGARLRLQHNGNSRNRLSCRIPHHALDLCRGLLRCGQPGKRERQAENEKARLITNAGVERSEHSGTTSHNDLE